MTHEFRSEPVSIHLERHREFLERQGIEAAIAGGVDNAPGPPPLDMHAGGAPVLPFGRRDDQD